jgi:hypothetical protein
MEEVLRSLYHSYKDQIFQKCTEIENHNLLKIYLRMVEEYYSNFKKLEKLKENESLLESQNQNGNENQNENKNENENQNENQIGNGNENLIKNKVIDEIFSKYLIEVSEDCNKFYFKFVVKFVILFRECINKTKIDSNFTLDYSAFNNADSVPDTCNEFITDFMEGYDYFGLDTMELIEIIQHLCHWLYENKFTTSKLSLVS